MPTLAGWLTGEQVPQEFIEQALITMGEVLGRAGGQPARTTQPGAGLIAFSDPAYSTQHNTEPPVLDWVPDRRTLVYRRPLSGLHPLYYIENWPAQGNLLFASEIKALFAVGVPRRLHLAALDALLRYGFIPAPLTAFKEIYVVPAGSILRWQRATTVLNWSTDYQLEQRLKADEARASLHQLLQEAVASLLPSHEQLVAFSNGDSASALAIALAAQRTSAPFTVASLGYKKMKSKQIWQEAERVATSCQLPFLAITGLDQPEFWVATLNGLEAPVTNSRMLALHQLFHTTAMETGARVAISATGAHLLTGSGQLEPKPSYHKREDIFQRYSRTIAPRWTGKADELWSADTLAQLQQEEPWEETLHARKLARKASQFTDVSQGQYYLDLHLRLPDLLVNAMQALATPERMAIRSPFLHMQVIEALVRLPMSQQTEQAGPALLTQLARQYIPDIGLESLTSSLEAPSASLLHLDGSELLAELLSVEALKSRGIFNQRIIQQLFSERQTPGNRRALLLVFTTQLLCHLFAADL
ncbi:hypothetical protein EPA93_20780 [Ktedonosporobacter rubrisoli]|uniref:asparagine synthase (glutamine-hydrolyzing) n=1 Tax=Ktedonosporobacter rubrisoli TaxID=2509675 RepID=A0A4P6JST5_KTERU|nr:asparagine synthase-related protein [Ktedonosporobacter rubrisoli]QBD78302.1 hypothetical protein EPA93_20780 [Ktedonosporobacter rubrisoli]